MEPVPARGNCAEFLIASAAPRLARSRLRSDNRTPMVYFEETIVVTKYRATHHYERPVGLALRPLSAKLKTGFAAIHCWRG
jgi:hypothetical protein